MQEDILDIFSELEVQDSKWILDRVFSDAPDDANMHIVNESHKDTATGRISTLSEVFLEWYLFDAGNNKTIASFLKENELQDIFDEADFTDLMFGRAFLYDDLLRFVLIKLPFNIVPATLRRMNSDVARSQGTRGIASKKDLFDKTCDLVAEKTEQRRQKQHEYCRKCNAKHKEQRRAYKKQYRAEHVAEIAAYTAQYNAAHRAERAAYAKRHRTQCPETVAATRKKYRATHHEQIAAYDKKYQANRKAIMKQKAESAQKICAAYVFLLNLKKQNRPKYLELYTKKQNPLCGMLKTCVALQKMDIKLCPFCNPICEDMMEEWCNKKLLAVPNAINEIRKIADNLRQK